MRKWWKRQVIPFILCPAQMKTSKLQHRRIFDLPRHYLSNKRMIKNKYFTIIIFASCLCASACVSSNNAIYRDTKRVQNSSQSATEMLQSEFEITKRALIILEKASRCLDADKPVSKETFCEIIEIISEFSDKCHQEKEDKVLFPFLKNAQGGEKKDFLGQLLMEHVSARDM